MDDNTYETKDSVMQVETYEWDNVWWEQAPDNTRPRVLYIGDSISCGIRRIATGRSDNRILFDGFGTSKAIDNEYLEEGIRLFGKQQKKRKIIVFNNGLHGFHLSDTQEYRIHYEQRIKFLLEEYQGTAILLALTTCVAGARNKRVIARNDVVRKIAEKYSLRIIDLYSTSVEYVNLRCNDGVHFTVEGYEKLAEKLLEDIDTIFPEMQC